MIVHSVNSQCILENVLLLYLLGVPAYSLANRSHLPYGINIYHAYVMLIPFTDVLHAVASNTLLLTNLCFALKPLLILQMEKFPKYNT